MDAFTRASGRKSAGNRLDLLVEVLVVSLVKMMVMMLPLSLVRVLVIFFFREK